VAFILPTLPLTDSVPAPHSPSPAPRTPLPLPLILSSLPPPYSPPCPFILPSLPLILPSLPLRPTPHPALAGILPSLLLRILFQPSASAYSSPLPLLFPILHPVCPSLSPANLLGSPSSLLHPANLTPPHGLIPRGDQRPILPLLSRGVPLLPLQACPHPPTCEAAPSSPGGASILCVGQWGGPVGLLPVHLRRRLGVEGVRGRRQGQGPGAGAGRGQGQGAGTGVQGQGRGPPLPCLGAAPLVLWPPPQDAEEAGAPWAYRCLLAFPSPLTIALGRPTRHAPNPLPTPPTPVASPSNSPGLPACAPSVTSSEIVFGTFRPPSVCSSREGSGPPAPCPLVRHCQGISASVASLRGRVPPALGAPRGRQRRGGRRPASQGRPQTVKKCAAPSTESPQPRTLLAVLPRVYPRL